MHLLRGHLFNVLSIIGALIPWLMITFFGH